MNPPRVLLVHNRYLEHGGEDTVVEAESNLLRSYGHDVVSYAANNEDIKGMTTAELAVRTVWSWRDQQNIASEIDRSGADLVHVHNTFPLISPSIYYAARSRRVPVVQTLHNYRLLCPAGTQYRDGSVCTLCATRTVPWPAVRFACYRSSRTASSGVATMLTVHRLLRTYPRLIDAFIALTPFAADQFIEFGLPKQKVYIKPNFVSLEAKNATSAIRKDFALYVGRLSPEKGIYTLLRAWTNSPALPPLKIVGDGPLRREVESAARTHRSIEFVGWKTSSEVFKLMSEAQIMVFPSECYEGFPMTLVEAFAHGLPVVASDIGSLKSIVHGGDLGRRFPPGDHEALRTVTAALLEDRRAVAHMRESVRREFEAKYSSARNYDLLSQIYKSAMDSACVRYGHAHA